MLWFKLIDNWQNALLGVAIVLLPSLVHANGAYTGSANREQLIEALNSNPALMQQAKNSVLTNLPEIVQLLQQLPVFLSVSDNSGVQEGGVTPRKAPLNIGKARGTISRNLRPLNPTLNISVDNTDVNDDEFSSQTFWNAWADGYYFDVNDHRYSLDLNGHESLLVFGADRLVKENMAIGVLFSLQNAHSTNFGGNWLVKSDAITVGPYLAYQISPRWLLHTAFCYGYTRNNLNIGVINGDYIAQSYSFEIDFAGQYNHKVVNVRYKPSVYYSYIHNQAYQLAGTSRSGILFNIPVVSDNFSLGLISMLIEINRDFKFSNYKVLQPFAEIGVTYQFLRPNKGQILTGNLLLVTPSAWSGLARLGMRYQINRVAYMEANIGYLSIGQNGLNIWQGRLYFSYAF